MVELGEQRFKLRFSGDGAVLDLGGGERRDGLRNRDAGSLGKFEGELKVIVFSRKEGDSPWSASRQAAGNLKGLAVAAMTRE
jgi:hypothetical protein